ncbi:MAG: hypothetical protein WBX25_05025 [Rhodomicrobium sp.]
MSRKRGQTTKPEPVKQAEADLSGFPALVDLNAMPAEERRDLKRMVKVEAREMCQQFTRVAVLRLVDLCERGTSDEIKLRAAEAILDRGWGRPAQAITQQWDGKLTISWMTPGDDARVIDGVAEEG